MTNYYVSTSGSDSNNGTSTSTPWQTLTKVNSHTFNPGDTISFNGGQNFAGNGSNPALSISQSGSSGAPITINSYGTGQAQISGGAVQAILGTNCSYVTVTNLAAVSTAPNSNGSGGNSAGTIEFAITTTSGIGYPGIAVTNCTVTGGNAGLWAKNPAQPYTDYFQGVMITGNTVSGSSGMGIVIATSIGASYAGPYGTNIGAYVGKNLVYGVTATTTYVANGINISGTDSTSVIELNTVHDIGASLGSTLGASTGNAGIQLDVFTGTIVRYNEVYNVKAPNGAIDGVGLDFDVYSSNGMGYGNFVHDCDGAGLLIDATSGSGNTWAFNILVNNNKVRMTDPAIRFDAGTSSYIFNNTVINNNPVAYNVNLAGIGTLQSISSAYIYNNAISISQGYALLLASGTKVAGNFYSVGSSAFCVYYAGNTYNTLASFQAASTNNENGTGTVGNPLLVNPLATVVTGGAANLNHLANWRPTAASPLLGAGLNLKALYGIQLPPADAAGVTLPGSGYAVGAYNATAPNVHNPYDTAVLNDSPQYYFHHRETTGTSANNLGMQGGSATLDSTIELDQGALTAGTNNTLAVFTGGATGVAVGTGYQPASELTLTYEGWITPTSVSGTEWLCNLGTGAPNVYFQVALSAGVLTAIMGNNGGTVWNSSGPTLAVGTQYHIVVAINGAYVNPGSGFSGGTGSPSSYVTAQPNFSNGYPYAAIYVNNALEVYANNSYGQPSYSSTAIAGATTNLGQGLNAKVEREAIYFTALQPAAVANHYNAGLATPNAPVLPTQSNSASGVPRLRTRGAA